MRIGIIASVWISVPPSDFGFGAQEYLASAITENLVKQGHDVTLFASGDSKTSAKLVSVCDKAVRGIEFPDQIASVFELMNVEAAISQSKQFDVINNHLLPYGLPLANLSRCPVVHTLHHQIYNHRAGKFLYEHYRNQSFISISNSQRLNMPELNYVETIYNGTDTNFYSFSDYPVDQFAVMTRLKRYKGVHTAIEAAVSEKFDLKIAAPLPTKNQPDYTEVNEYWEEIEPKINKNENIEYLGSVSGKNKLDLLKNSKAFLFPVERPEPFGMTIIESMACGTPVIAFNQGAVPEIIDNGIDGLIVDPEDGVEGFIKAIKRLNGLSQQEYLAMRQAARKKVENKFSVERMVDHYEQALTRAAQ